MLEEHSAGTSFEAIAACIADRALDRSALGRAANAFTVDYKGRLAGVVFAESGDLLDTRHSAFLWIYCLIFHIQRACPEISRYPHIEQPLISFGVKQCWQHRRECWIEKSVRYT